MKSHLAHLGLAILAVFAPAQSMIISTLVLVVVDLITGLIAAHKQGIPITSSGLRRTIGKTLIYEVVILIAFLAQQYLTGPVIPVSSIAAGFIGLTELTSCVENLNVIGGGSLLKALLTKLDSANKS
jgi:phage-related holin